MGNIAATTVNVAIMVGLPTSATASIVACRQLRPFNHFPVARYIFDHDYGIVSKDRDGEYKTEHSQSVKRDIEQPTHKKMSAGQSLE